MACAEYLLIQVAMQTVLRYGLMEVGNIGEEVASDLAINRMGMSDVGFTAARQGLDGVFSDNIGNTVVIESKCHSTTGFPPLSETKSGGYQMSNRWIEVKTQLMRNENSKQSSGNNPKIALDIRAAMSNGTLRCILIHTNPETHEIRAYERISDQNVQSSSSWRLIDSWKEK